MKRPFLLFLAAGLVALGAGTDHLFSSSQTPAAAAISTSTPVTQTGALASVGATIASPAVDTAIERAYAVASPSVVSIVSAGVGSGSGLIYDARGDIVTNAHVVDSAQSLSVTLSDGRTATARLVGTDAADDLAVIRISASGLKPAHFARAGTYRVAQMVLAIGNPLGLKGSVTSGLISGLHRVEQEPNGAYLPNTLQTSAAINPGNSGGALVALDGTVVGMPTLEQTSAQNGSSTQAIGFAIASERIVAVANQIVCTGKVEHTGRAYLGISPTDANGASSSPFGGSFDPNGSRPAVTGALVQRLAAGGPADSAGVQQGDVIIRAGGTAISGAQDLLSVLAAKKPGDTITLELDRNGSKLTVHAHLSELPA